MLQPALNRGLHNACASRRRDPPLARPAIEQHSEQELRDAVVRLCPQGGLGTSNASSPQGKAQVRSLARACARRSDASAARPSFIQHDGGRVVRDRAEVPRGAGRGVCHHIEQVERLGQRPGSAQIGGDVKQHAGINRQFASGEHS